MKDFNLKENCPQGTLLALKDTLNVVSGKWKIPIIAALIFGAKRFTDIEKLILDITPRMLSKELKELEANGVVKRSVYDTRPITVEYELTDSGMSLRQVIRIMAEWGIEHRKNTIG